MNSTLFFRVLLIGVWIMSVSVPAPWGGVPASGELGPHTPLAAPRVSVITVSASPTSILADGYATSRITILLMEDGLPGVRKQVNVSTTLGTLSQIVVLTNSHGQASVTLRSGKIPGTATITAWNDDASDETTVELLGATPVTLTGKASPAKLDADGLSFSYITAQVKAINDLPIQGYTMTFTTDLGTIPITGVTDAQGVVVVHLTAGLQPGTATVTLNAPPLQTTVPVEIVTPRLKTYVPLLRK